MKGRILTSLLAMMAMAGMQAQEAPGAPRLVVGLTIEQLRMDYIEAFSELFGTQGFKRLWKEGGFIKMQSMISLRWIRHRPLLLSIPVQCLICMALWEMPGWIVPPCKS